MRTEAVCFLVMTFLHGIVSEDLVPSSGANLATGMNASIALMNGTKGWKLVAFFHGNAWPKISDRWTSQVGQDKTIVSIFKGKRGGFFVDLAANDAKKLSNTLTLEQEYGWNGLCVEPMPMYLNGHLKRRCMLAAAVAGAQTGEQVTFASRSVLSGIVRSDMDNKESQPGTKKAKRMTFTTVSVSKMFRDFGVPKVIDYMSLDIEGAEYYTFKDFPWSEYKFLALTVERPKALRAVLEANDYFYVKDHGTFGDALFIHRTLPNFDEVMRGHGKLNSNFSATGFISTDLSTEVTLPAQKLGWKVVAFFHGNAWPKIPNRWTSQVGQDKTIVNIFNGKRGGFFVDFFANDAKKLSNTLTLEQEYGWNGLCVEPMPMYLTGHLQRRCMLAAAVAGAQTGEQVTFASRSVLSGIVRSDMDNKESQPGTKKAKRMTFTTVSVSKMFRDFGVPKVIDYMSLDIEGAEYYTFKGFPWSEYKFLALTVERPNALRAVLEANDYFYVKDHGNFGDAMFIHRTLPNFDEVMSKHNASMGFVQNTLDRSHGVPPMDRTGESSLVSNSSAEHEIPWVAIPQCQIDGFWSNMRPNYLNVWFVKRLRANGASFKLALPVFRFHARGNPHQHETVRFADVFDVRHLEQSLGVDCISMEQFNAGKKEGFVLYSKPDGYRCGSSAKLLVGVDQQGFTKKTVGDVKRAASVAAMIIKSNQRARIVIHGVSPPTPVVSLPDLRFYLNSSRVLPSFLLAIFESTQMVRFSTVVQNAAKFALQHWGLDGKKFMAVHVRRGDTYQQKGKLGQATDIELSDGFNRAISVQKCSGDALSAVVVSALHGDDAEVFRKLAPSKQIFTFDSRLREMIREKVSGMANCKSSICLDLVEVAVWMHADVFLGTRSTMSEMTFLLRMQRGFSQDEHCSFHAQPCFSFSNSYYLASKKKRIACEK